MVRPGQSASILVRDNMRLPLILGIIGVVELDGRGQQAGLGSASLLLYFGVTFTIQRFIVQARAASGSRPARTAPHASW